MSRKVTYEVWGKRAPYAQLAQFVLVQEDETNIEAVLRSVKRRTGAHVAYYVGEGYEPETRTNVYKVTLGRHSIERLFTGPTTTEIFAEFWVRVPADEEREEQ